MNRKPNATVVRIGKGQSNEANSSSDEEVDAFSALARKKMNSKQVSSNQKNQSLNKLDEKSVSAAGEGETSIPLSSKVENIIEDRVGVGASQRRYHHQSEARNAKMNSLLLELQETATHAQAASNSHAVDRPPPDKIGSYCLPGEELVTANLFVGNLAPCTTEEELTEIFQQFGDLYSVKIMWPRNDDERIRGRNTGFVCFMNRDDATRAMEYYQETDPLNTGKKMMIRWGKDVKNSDRRTSHVNASTQQSSSWSSINNQLSVENSLPVNHSTSSLSDRFVDVEEDASSSNWKKKRYETSDDPHDHSPMIIETKICSYPVQQDDDRIPKSKLTTNDRQWRPEQSLSHKASIPSNKKSAAAGATLLTNDELDEWHDIIHHRLCASKSAVLEAMTFCFDRSTAAAQISELLQMALLDDRKRLSIDTRIARLFLLSDILFNSQQPGVKNAYRYRDAIERMAPDIFTSLGKHGQKHGEMVGRMTLNRLRTAVKAVLSAWSAWSVYNTTFLDELDALFEGVQINTDKGDGGTNEDEPSENMIEKTPAIESDILGDIDGEELDETDLMTDDIDGESLSESELLY